MRSPLKGLSSLPSKRKQKGAVAIIFGLTAVVLLSMGGLVLDMGHLYIAKAELQNAADAAALAGARRLDETAAGITNARNDAIAIAALNNFDFATPLIITGANTEFSSNPGGPWVGYATALANSAGITFVRVNTGARTLPTYLMSVAGIYTVSTFGDAVAGRFVNNVTPIGICAIDLNRGGTRPTTPVSTDNELTEFGYRRGVSYNVFELNGPGFPPSTPYLLNPINVYPGVGAPSTCAPANSSANTTAPFICSGTSAVLVTTPGTVYGNSGLSAGKIQAALNSRFDNYGGPSVCIPALAPPDANIRPYPCTTGANCDTTNTISASLPNTWMDPSSTTTPNSRQTFNLAGISSLNDYGVLWSYSRAMKAVGTSPNATAGANFTPADWTKLYPTPALSAEATYPGGLAGTTESPYLEPSTSSYFRSPTNPGVAKRRVLNLAIANCSPGAISGSGSCTVIPILGIGRFFMQVPADLSGSPQKLEVEFAGLIEPVPVSEIKLYR